MTVIRLAGAIFAALLTVSCATEPPTRTVEHKELTAPYRLDSGDAIRVIVFGQTDLTNTYAVDRSGKVSMPLIGYVEVRNQTVAEVEQKITAALKDGFIRAPDVSVEVDRYRPFFVLGEVGEAGQYAYVSGMTVQAAVAAAGGFARRADREVVNVTRSANGVVTTAQLLATDPIMPGDTITVRERPF